MKSISASTQDLARQEQRFKEYVDLRGEQQKEKLREIETDHELEISRLRKLHEKQREDLEKAYKLDLQRVEVGQRENLEKTRNQHVGLLHDEKKAAEEEFEDIQTREQKRIEEYKKNQEMVLAKLKEEFYEAEAEMRASHDD